MKPVFVYLIGAVVGGVAGYLYYRFVGCVTGACPLTANPFISSIYGAVLGALISSFFIK
ncbi:MAG: DUF6132 family protein [Christensenellales bacterium]|jgi:hypothetical protein